MADSAVTSMESTVCPIIRRPTLFWPSLRGAASIIDGMSEAVLQASVVHAGVSSALIVPLSLNSGKENGSDLFLYHVNRVFLALNQAQDARFVVGLEQQAELMLKMMSILEADSILQALTNSSPTSGVSSALIVPLSLNSGKENGSDLFLYHVNRVFLALNQAQDARFVVGLEQAELMLKMMSILEADSILQALTNSSPTLSQSSAGTDDSFGARASCVHLGESVNCSVVFHSHAECLLQQALNVVTLCYHNNRPFTTKDRDYDAIPDNCATIYKGAWWYGDCHDSNLNGQYLRGTHSSHGDGVNLRTGKGQEYSYKITEMKFGPV